MVGPAGLVRRRRRLNTAAARTPPPPRRTPAPPMKAVATGPPRRTPGAAMIRSPRKRSWPASSAPRPRHNNRPPRPSRPSRPPPRPRPPSRPRPSRQPKARPSPSPSKPSATPQRELQRVMSSLSAHSGRGHSHGKVLRCLRGISTPPGFVRSSTTRVICTVATSAVHPSPGSRAVTGFAMSSRRRLWRQTLPEPPILSAVPACPSRAER